MKKFLIASYHDIFVDEFDKGEQPYSVNNYSLTAVVIEANTALEAVEIYTRTHLYVEVKPEQMEVDEEETNKVLTSFLVDPDNYPASDRQVRMWKEGKQTLYSNHTTIEVHELITVTIK